MVDRHICEVDITSSGLLVPADHGVDSFGELVIIPLVNAAGVYPEVSQTVGCSLVRAKLDLLPPRLAFAGARLHILKADLITAMLDSLSRGWAWK